MPVVLLLLGLIASALPARAAEEPVVVGWVEMPPFFSPDENGELEGFSVDLIEHVAEIIDIDYRFQRYDDIPALFRAQRRGESTLIPGLAALSSLNETSVFSAPVGETLVRLFLRADRADNSAYTSPTGRRIGIAAALAEVETIDLLQQNQRVDLPNDSTLLIHLLRGWIDAAVVPQERLVAAAHALELDHLILPAGDVLRRFDRVLALHESRADLLPRIDAAIAQLDMSGELAAMRERWFLEMPPSEPDVLTVGVTDFGSYTQIEEDGSFSGFAYDALRAIAGQADVKLNFIPLTTEEWAPGPGVGRFDMLPQISINDERATRMDFTLPIEVGAFAIFRRSGETEGVGDITSLSGRVGVRSSTAASRIAREAGLDHLIEFETLNEMVAALRQGDIGSFLYAVQPVEVLIEQEKLADEISMVQPPFRIVERAIALRRGLGPVRERLNAVIPGFLISDEYADLKARYFGTPDPWWRQYGAWILAAAGLLTLALLGIIGYASWRRRAEAVLIRQKLISDIFEGLPFAVTLNDTEGRIRFFNDAYRKLYPKSADLMIEGVDYADLIKAGAERGEYELAGKTPEEWITEFTGRHESGDSRYDVPLADGRIIEALVSPMHDDGRLIVRRDVTAERREGERLRAVLDAATSGIIGLDLEKNIVFANLIARDLLGGLADEAVCPWPSAIRFLDQENLEPLEASNDPVHRALAGQTLKGEINLMSRRGTPDFCYVRISSAPVMAPNTPVAVVVVLDDVSEQERNRQQVERSSRLDALGQLTGGIAHDFNNLLATIQYALDLAITDDLGDDQRGILETAARSVDRGAKLTNRLLAFAKRQPGLAASRGVDDILNEFRLLAAPTIEERIELVFPAPDPDLRVFCDAAQLENALLNLVLNSRDAMLRAGTGNRIEILVRRIDEADAASLPDAEQAGTFTSAGMEKEQEADRKRDDQRSHRYIEIAVSDNGPGMSEEVKRRALDPFFTTKNTNSGTGLGLSMVYGFVQQSNGELRIYSEKDVGTSVRLRLPAASSAGDREKPAERPLRAPGRGQRILIVEDEEGLREMMEAQIRTLGYQVLTAASGDDALLLMEAGTAFELLLTDVVMPGKTGGFELARQLRQQKPDLPIIYMSGYTGFSSKEMGDAPGVLLQKPCPPAELAQALSRALDNKSQAA